MNGTATVRKMRPEAQRAPVPASHADALVAGRIRTRRQELDAHNPAAIEVAGSSLRAGADVAWGHVPSLRCDRQVRYREAQLQGEKALPWEDLVAMAMEGPEGERTFLEIIRAAAALAPSVPHLVVPAPADARVEKVAFDVLTQGAEAARTVADALRDGRIDAAEMRSICPAARELLATLTTLLSLLSRAEAA